MCNIQHVHVHVHVFLPPSPIFTVSSVLYVTCISSTSLLLLCPLFCMLHPVPPYFYCVLCKEHTWALRLNFLALKYHRLNLLIQLTLEHKSRRRISGQYTGFPILLYTRKAFAHFLWILHMRTSKDPLRNFTYCFTSCYRALLCCFHIALVNFATAFHISTNFSVLHLQICPHFPPQEYTTAMKLVQIHTTKITMQHLFNVLSQGYTWYNVHWL